MRLTSWTTAGNAVELLMSRQDIADYLGLTIETVSRTLTSLETAATIDIPTSRRIVLRNRGALNLERLGCRRQPNIGRAKTGRIGVMQVRDVMTRNVIAAKTDDSILTAARLMLQNRISGLPVLDAGGALVGVVTEGDFLRRGELGTKKHRPRWVEFLLGPGKLAEEYVHETGRKVSEVMTPNPHTVSEDATLQTVVTEMERYRVKRLPVMRNGQLVGIVSRANLLHALASLARETPAPSGDDAAIRDQILEALAKQRWALGVNVVVKSGIAEIWGTIMDERERQATIVAVENVPGVKQVHDHLVWVEPMSGMAFPSAEDEARDATAAKA
jgi:CBS domain-containing protein